MSTAATASTLHGRLRPALSLARHRHRSGAPVRLGEVVETLGPGGAPFAAVLLALPFAVPVSLGPVTTPVSIVLLLIGLRVARGRTDFLVPPRWLGVPLPGRALGLLRRSVVNVSRRARWHRVRVEDAGAEGAFQRTCGWGMAAGAVLLGVPIPLLPLTNTFPALAVVAFSLALLLGRPRLFTAGAACCIMSVLIFALVGAGIAFLGFEGLRQIMTPG